MIYTGPVYAQAKLSDALCPWCIASGAAHVKFAASFVDSEAFADDVPEEAQDEIMHRTPGFASWQTERWLSTEGLPAAFIEPAGIREIRARYPRLEGDLMSFVVHELGVSGGAATRLLQSLDRDRGPTAYVFRCGKHDQFLGYIDLL